MNQTITKHWGTEQLIFVNDQYMVKKLTMLNGKACSWHRHDVKTETLTVLDGALLVRFDCGDVTALAGQSLTLQAGVPHRMEAPWGTVVYLESSNPSDQATRLRAWGVTKQHAMTGRPQFVECVMQGRPLVKTPAWSEDELHQGARIWTDIPVTFGELGGEQSYNFVNDPMEKLGDAEHTYVAHDRVGKWFKDPYRALAVAHRFNTHPAAPNARLDGHWVSYSYLPEGDDWDAQSLWDYYMTHADIKKPSRSDRAWSQWFLRDRTLDRLRTHRPSLLEQATKWAGWSYLIDDTLPALNNNWHGDLGYENVVGDWFIDLHEEPIGDMHYDAAKLVKSCWFSHKTCEIKAPETSFTTSLLNEKRTAHCLVVVVMKMAGAHGGTLGKRLEEWARDLMVAE